MKLAALLSFVLSLALHAQILHPNPVAVSGTSVPTGPCGGTEPVYTNSGTGNVYACLNGLWSVIGGSTNTGTPTVIPAPTASSSGGTFTGSQTLSLSTTATNGVIHYTTDGTTPTCASPVYSGAITVAATETVQAVTCTASAASTVAFVISTGGGGGGGGSSVVPITAVSLGQGGNLNGWIPFSGSIALSPITSNAIDTTNTSYFHSSNSGAVTNFDQIGSQSSDLEYHVLNSATDSTVYWVPIETDYEAANPGQYDTETDHVMVPVHAGIYGEGHRDITTCLNVSTQDIHGIILDVATSTLYSGYQTRICNGIMRVYSMTVRRVDHPFEIQEPRGRTTEDVAGMVAWPAILGVRYEDIANGAINHALRFTTHLASQGPSGGFGSLFTGPASHGACSDGNCSSTRASMFGERVILSSTYNCSSLSTQGQIICATLKTYGGYVADNGLAGQLAFQGMYDSRLGSFAELDSIPATAFSVVTETGKDYVAQVPDEASGAGNGGTSELLDETTLYSNSTAGAAVSGVTPKPTITSFTASATTVPIGQSVTFNYVGTNITTAFLDNAGNGARWGNSGSITWTPSGTATYQLTAKGYGGWTYSTPVTVTVTGTQVANPTSTPAPGTSTSPINIALADSTSGAVVHYTTDGSNANCLSTPYSAPISLTSGALTINAMGCLSGDIPSTNQTFSYVVQSSGAVPSVVGQATSGGQTDGATETANYTFASGSSAVILLSWINTASLPTSVTCGGSAATLITSQVGPGTGNQFSEAAYFLQTVPTGATSCTATWSTSVYGTTQIVAVAGTSGTDGSGTGTTDAYPAMTCGTFTTTGTNRLLIAAAQVPYNGSAFSAASGYTLLYAAGGTGADYIAHPTAGSVSPTVNTANDSANESCLSFALKP